MALGFMSSTFTRPGKGSQSNPVPNGHRVEVQVLESSSSSSSSSSPQQDNNCKALTEKANVENPKATSNRIECLLPCFLFIHFSAQTLVFTDLSGHSRAWVGKNNRMTVVVNSVRTIIERLGIVIGCNHEGIMS